MQKFLVLILFIVFMCANTLKSQDLPIYEQYMFDWTLVNPSFMGLSESTSAKLMHREQWIGIENSPRTSLFLFKRRLRDRTGGYGGYIFSDRNGPSQKHGFSLSWSFQALIDARRYDRFVLSFGMSFKGLFHVLDETQFEQDIYDPIIDYTKKQTFVPNVKAGVLFSYSDYFLGFSGDNLIQFNDRMYNLSIEPPVRIIGNFHGGAVFRFSERFQIRPSTLYKTNFRGLNQLDVNAKFNMFSGRDIRSVYLRHSKEFWIGLSYKHTFDAAQSSALAFCPSIGFSVNNFTFAYLYDLGLTSLNNYHYGTHQISIGLRFFPDQYVNWGKHHIPLFLEDF